MSLLSKKKKTKCSTPTLRPFVQQKKREMRLAGGGESSRITIIVILLSVKHPLDMDALIAGMPLTASDVFKPGQSPKCRFFDKVFESLSLTIDHLM